MKISLSIVLYQTDKNELLKLVDNIFSTKQDFLLYLIDNSPSDYLKLVVGNLERLIYIHNPSNPGFGAAHNIAIKSSIDEGIQFHFIVNPDISFSGDVITPMVEYMLSDNSIGMLMPKILNNDGTTQYLPKLLPSPFWILRRKFKFPRDGFEKFVSKYELRSESENEIFNAPLLSGCFTLINLCAIKKVGMYDDKFFMYFEDFDLSRRIHNEYKTIYFPKVSVFHGYEGGANKNLRLFRIFVNSAIHYFSKWGWIFDRDRVLINKKALQQFNR